MRRVLFICSALILFGTAAYAQKSKPWTEWSQKEAEKILNDSAWGQTQTERGAGGSSQPAQTSAVTSTTLARREDSSTRAASGVESGEKKESPSVHFRVRLMSAKPIRAAFVRMVELQGAPAEKVAQLKTFVDRDFADYIVVTISLDGSDKKLMAPAMQILANADAPALKNTTYLERKDGKKLDLMDYRAPIQDGLGAKFVFPRHLDGKPFLDSDSGELRFTTELVKGVKINRRFKVSEMLYDGKLEF